MGAMTRSKNDTPKGLFYDMFVGKLKDDCMEIACSIYFGAPYDNWQSQQDGLNKRLLSKAYIEVISFLIYFNLYTY
jgi:hypothetical protein